MEKSIQKNIKALIIGAYGADNWGDEAILDSILSDLKSILPNSKPRVLSGNPTRTQELHNIQAAPLAPIFRGFLHPKAIHQTNKFFHWADVVILGGGGLFQDHEFKALLIWCSQLFMAHFHKKPIFIWGISIGPLQHKISKIITIHTLKKAKFITVRDQRSFDFLIDHGISTSKIAITADPAILIPNKHIEVKKKKVIFALRPLKNLPKDFPITISQFVGFLVEQGFQVEFIAMQSGGENSDPRFAMQVARNFPLFIPKTLQSAISRIARAEILIGMRLHSLIFATTQNVPFLSLSYSPKVTSFSNEIGASDFNMPARKATFKSLTKLFSNLIANPPHLKKAEMRNRATQTKTIFQKFLTKENLI